MYYSCYKHVYLIRLVVLSQFFYQFFSQNSPNGLCVKVSLNQGNAEWVKTDCADTSGKGYICQRRQNVEDVGKANIKPKQLWQ